MSQRGLSRLCGVQHRAVQKILENLANKTPLNGYEKTILIPQQDAILYEDGIEFDGEGKEEYIGIVIDNPLNLPWLNPYPEEPVLKWQGKDLEQV
ncbi:hypothetical protein [Nostoc sp. MG11]|uniref:hypothetical protein n=1 Tax=Nostoc sp. MG11 TaxID=2721166 RepID=UPI00186857F5|nr:hypothetical protein [Nostoc sp. MG11]